MESHLFPGGAFFRRFATLVVAVVAWRGGDAALLRSMAPVGPERVLIVGAPGVVSELATETVWREGLTVLLDGRVIVPAGGSLTIEAGVIVEAGRASEIVVERDARFDIQGTIARPVVLTCSDNVSAPGCWDGVTILGNAPINHGAPTSPAGTRGGSGGCLEARVGRFAYGGCNAGDSSGVLRYTRVQYAARGLRLLGVGSGTVVSHVQVHRSTGNGLEVRGGTARLRFVALTTNAQYGLVYGGGWTGQAQYVVVQQDRTGYAGGVLGDNSLASTTSIEPNPLSRPTIANLTVVAPISESTNPYAATTPGALRFRHGVAGTFHNVLLVEPGIGVDADDIETCDLIGAGLLTLRGVALTLPSAASDPDVDPQPCGVTGEAYLLRNATTITGAGADQQLVSPIDVVLPDLRPRPSTTLASTLGVPPTPLGIIEAATYLGAIAPSGVFRNEIPWYSGWTQGEILPPPSPSSLTGVVAAAGRGGLVGVTVSLAPSDGSATTGAFGAFAATVPAGPVDVNVISGLPAGCVTPPPRSVVVRPGIGATIESVAACPADPTGQLRSLAVGAFHSCGLATDGAAWCWGDNSSGQLGDGSLSTRLVPRLVSGALQFTTLSAGLLHTCGITIGGDAYCWGWNAYGQLGDGAVATHSQPTLVVGGLDFAAIDAASFHTCAVATNGAAHCWGRNADQQLGDGTTTPRLVPTPVSGGISFVGITTGYAHSCGLTVSGAVHCWGFNVGGALGDGTNSARATPTAVIGGATFARVEAGTGYTCAIEIGGTALCWGANLVGQLGDGTVTSRLRPTAVSGEQVFISLSVADSHSCGITPLGATYCWGANGQGQLGDGTATSRRTPTLVSGAMSGAVIANGYTHTCALLSNASARCWGANTAGQLGDGSNAQSPLPVIVSGGLTFALP